MADKRIVDLQLRSDVDDDVQFATDDGTQSYRVSAPQVKKYVGTQKIVGQSTTASIDGTADVVLGDATGGDITISLPPATGVEGKVFKIKNYGATGVVTVDANSSETIDGALTIDLEVQNQAIEIYSDGANWLLVSREKSKFVPLISGTCGGFSTTSPTPSLITNMSLDAENDGGRKFEISFQSDGSGNESYMGAGILGASVICAAVAILKRNSTEIARYRVGGTAINNATHAPSSSVSFLDFSPDAGTNTYELFLAETDNGAGATAYFQYANMVIKEI